MPGAPTGLTATGGNGAVQPVLDRPGLQRRRGDHRLQHLPQHHPGGEGTTPIPTGTGTTYTDTALTNGTTYYYTVAAINSAGTGPQSGEASATPQAAVTVPGPRRADRHGGNG